ncbi:MAG: hypothetical protein LKJ83_04125 [Eubacteriaceae bacterium]|nr:hypothetical protein [Eubacteriaceae bacterium]
MFKKICFLDQTSLNDEAMKKLSTFCEELTVYDDYPTDADEIAKRIGDADAVLLSYNTTIPQEALEKCPNVKYIGMCCTYYGKKSANIPAELAEKRGIEIRGVSGYSDIGPCEFVVCALLNLLHGYYGPTFGTWPHELHGIPVGIVGAGVTGRLCVQYLKSLGADVAYADVVECPELDALGIPHLSMESLLKRSTIISTHIPRNIEILKKQEFEMLGNNKIVINVSVGPTFNVPDMIDWLKQCPNNYYVCDEVGMGSCWNDFNGIENCISTHRAAGSSVECTKRLSEGVIKNICDYLAEC